VHGTQTLSVRDHSRRMHSHKHQLSRVRQVRTEGGVPSLEVASHDAPAHGAVLGKVLLVNDGATQHSHLRGTERETVGSSMHAYKPVFSQGSTMGNRTPASGLPSCIRHTHLGPDRQMRTIVKNLSHALQTATHKHTRNCSLKHQRIMGHVADKGSI
jgi:hypothetical protein